MPDDLREFAHRCGLYHWALAVWTNGYAAGMHAVIQADIRSGPGRGRLLRFPQRKPKAVADGKGPNVVVVDVVHLVEA